MKALFKSLLILAAIITFAACEDVPAPYPTPGTGGEQGGTTTEEVAEGDGTLASPYNPVAANAFIATLAADAESESNIYVKGIICSIKENSNTQYGNASFYISADGKSSSTQFYVYRCYGPDNKKFTQDNLLNVGDEVVICGKVVNYKGNTPETVQNKSYIYSLNGNGGNGEMPEIKGDNLLANGDFEAWEGDQPTNWKSASTASNATLSQSTEAHGGNYAVSVGFNETQNKRLAYKEITLKAGTYEYSFYAKATTSAASQCQAGYVPVTNGSVGNYNYFGYTSLNNANWTKVSSTFTLDTQTTLCLVVMNPKTSNFATAQDILIDDAALKTNDGGIADGGGDTPNTPSEPTDPSGDGTLNTPYNVSGVLAYINTLGADTPSPSKVYVKGKISTIVQVETSQYGNAQFKISDDGTTANEFMCYNCFYLGNTKFTSANQIKVGDEVVIYGNVVNYKGNTPETVNKESYIYSLNGKTEGGNDTPNTPDTPGDVTGDANIVFASLGLSNGATIDTQTVGDITISTDGGGNNNAPKYYDAGKNARMYPKNSMTITAKQNIESIVLNCDSYQGIVCVAEGHVSADPGTVNVEDNLISITGIGSNTVTFTNNHPSSGTASQIRIISIAINYAK